MTGGMKPPRWLAGSNPKDTYDELLALLAHKVLYIMAEPHAERPRTTVAVVHVGELQRVFLFVGAILGAALDRFAEALVVRPVWVGVGGRLMVRRIDDATGIASGDGIKQIEAGAVVKLVVREWIGDAGRQYSRPATLDRTRRQ